MSDGESGGAAREREHDAFGDHLAEQPARRCAECVPHRHLFAAGDGARHQQIRNVGAADQEHESDNRHQHDERLR